MSWPLCFCCASGPGSAEQSCPDGSSWSPAGFRALKGRGGNLGFFTQAQSHGRHWLSTAWFEFLFLFFACVSGFFPYLYHSKVKFLFLSS